MIHNTIKVWLCRLLAAAILVSLAGCTNNGSVLSSIGSPSSSGPKNADDDAGVYVPRTPAGIDPTGYEAGMPILSAADAVTNEVWELQPDTKVLGNFLLTRESNPQLPFGVACYFFDNHITALLPAGVDRTALIPTFAYYGREVSRDGAPVVSEVTALDFSEPVILTLTAEDGSVEEVTVTVETLDTGIPSFAVTTADFAEITSRTSTWEALFYLGGGDPAICPYAADTPFTGTGTVKGRGNSSWGHAKKGYTVKLDEKARLLDMSRSRNWSLVSNHEDKALLRNVMAEYLADAAGIEFIMKIRPVDLWYNGRYWGTYNLSEKVKVDSERVNIAGIEPDWPVEQVGYLMEFDGHVNEIKPIQKQQWMIFGVGAYDPVSGDVFYCTSLGGKWVSIKEPKYEDLTEEHAYYIFGKVEDAIHALKSGNYAEIEELIDVRSFAKWYLVEEWTNNHDSSMHSSVFMTLDPGGRFKLGPVWDFDRSSGNCDYWNKGDDIDSLYTSGAGWFHLLFKCREAREILKEEWELLNAATADLSRKLNEWAGMISISQHWNFTVWSVWDSKIGSNPPEVVAAKSFEQQLALLRDYMSNRRGRMDKFIKGLKT
ncbi:MAG: CotH kinase family protein [Oscillospiraceae bacterium]|nr:CotH kinase family protein [Oscillospiraceae bacterium]